VSDPNLYLKYETSNIFLETVINEVGRSWSILTNHAGSCWASPTDARLRDIAASLGITGRSAYGIVTDLTAAGVPRQGRKTAADVETAVLLLEPSSVVNDRGGAWARCARLL
jgi:hypothetical protein